MNDIKQIRVVRTKSIPNVDSARLQDSLNQIHQKIHTVTGLLKWDKPRRGLVELGMKAQVIHAELLRRGVVPEVKGCIFCSRPQKD